MPDIDLLDPAGFRFGPPHHLFALLRNEHPVYLHRRRNLPPFWVLTRHTDVVSVSRDQDLFSSAANGALLAEEPGAEPSAASTSLLNLDPPDHCALRALAEKGFSPQAVDPLGHRIRTLCTLALDRVSERGECDFVQDVVAEFSLLPLAEMLGFPDATVIVDMDRCRQLV